MHEVYDASEVLLKLNTKLRCSRIELKFVFDNAHRRDENISVIYVDELECSVDEKVIEIFQKEAGG